MFLDGINGTDFVVERKEFIFAGVIFAALIFAWLYDLYNTPQKAS
jgi:hypothetical protein